jgi:hypothetical protein
VNELFGQPYDRRDLHWVIEAYFDRMYDDGRFVEALEHIVKQCGFSTDGAYCSFPDMNSYFEEDHFEGVRFSSGYLLEEDVSVVVSYEKLREFLRLACAKYLKRHPGDTGKISELLGSSN